MNMITLPKSTYNEILKRQARVEVAVAKLYQRVEELNEDELRPNVAARIERRSKAMDAGKGKRFKTIGEFRSYLRAL